MESEGDGKYAWKSIGYSKGAGAEHVAMAVLTLNSITGVVIKVYNRLKFV